MMADAAERGVDAPAALRDLPPSAKLVFKVLEYNDAPSYSVVVEKTRLPERTVNAALTRLKNRGLVAVERVPGDARQKRYRIAEC